jgi:hypothetical protein
MANIILAFVGILRILKEPKDFLGSRPESEKLITEEIKKGLLWLSAASVYRRRRHDRFLIF